MELTPAVRSLLQNRYGVARHRARNLGQPCEWPNFSAWLTSVLHLVQPGTDLTKARFFYDQKIEPGMTEKNLRVMLPKKRAEKAVAKIQQVDKALLLGTEEQRMLFAVELMARVLAPSNEELTEKIKAAAEVAGIDLRQ